MDNLKYQRCHCCKINGIFRRPCGVHNGAPIFLKYNWICSTCNKKGQGDVWNFAPTSNSLFEDPDDHTLENSYTLDQDKVMNEIIPKMLLDSKGFLFCHLNCNSVRNKWDELQILLCVNKLAVLSCTESKLDADRDSANMFTVNGFNTIRLDRNNDAKKSGGGTLIFVNKIFNVEHLDIGDFKGPTLNEVTVLKISKEHMKPIIVTTIYRHPETSVLLFIDFFKELNSFLTIQDCEQIIFGDFNIDLLKQFNPRLKFDENIHKFCLLCQEFGLWQLMVGPTFQKQSLLDHVYVNRKAHYSKSGHFYYGGSDHDLCFVVRKINKVKISPKMIQFRSYKNTDWKELEKELSVYKSHNIVNSKSTDRFIQMDNEFYRLNEHVLNVLEKHAPTKKRLVKGKYSPWLSSNYVKLAVTRNKLRNAAMLSNDASDWKMYRSSRNEANIMLFKNKKNYFTNKFSESTDTVNLWDTVDRLTNFRVKTRESISALEVNGKIVNTQLEINDEFAKVFVVEPKSNISDDMLKLDIDLYTENYDFTNSNCWEQGDIEIDKETMAKVINKMKNKKGNDPMFASLKVIQNCSSAFSVLLSALFIQIINAVSIPQCFRSVKVIPLYKGKGEKKVAKNYRPISLLNIYCKIFERYLYDRLSVRVESQLIDKQHAYRSKHSCHSALNIFTQYIYDSIDKPKTKVVAMFVDFKNAFNSVDHKLIIKKLMTEFKLEPWYVKILNENLRNRLFKLINNEKYYALPRGVPQGSALGPLLFSLYINNLDKVFSCPFLLYADDLVIYESGSNSVDIANKLVNEMEKLNLWCKDNFIDINFDKTKIMVFHKEKDLSVRQETFDDVFVDNTRIKRVFEFRYLGLIFDCCLKFDKHFSQVHKKVSQKLKYIQVS